MRLCCGTRRAMRCQFAVDPENASRAPSGNRNAQGAAVSELAKAIGQLTQAQAAAANWVDGALFVLAGPGSGKTRVLTTRVAKLLAETPQKSFRVLALTFTNKAADEMATRIEAFVPDQQRRATIGTFHSFCMQMLQ